MLGLTWTLSMPKANYQGGNMSAFQLFRECCRGIWFLYAKRQQFKPWLGFLLILFADFFSDRIESICAGRQKVSWQDWYWTDIIWYLSLIYSFYRSTLYFIKPYNMWLIWKRSGSTIVTSSSFNVIWLSKTNETCLMNRAYKPLFPVLSLRFNFY